MMSDLSNFSYIKKDILNPLPVPKINAFMLKNNEVDIEALSRFLSSNPGTYLNELNNLLYRSDNFKKDHNGTHVLFCGDSYTFGTGLLIEEVWSKKLYEKLSKEIELSGYFNLSHPGIPISSLIFDMFRYFKSFGNPDIIFLNITTPYRMFRVFREVDGGHHQVPIADSLLEAISYQYYYMLESYCVANKIKLYTFSWMEGHPFSRLDTLSRFYKFDHEDFSSWLIANPPKEKHNFLELSRDGIHPGTLLHDFFVDFIYEKYDNDNTRN